MKTALITGITGQDGSYLAEFLLSKDYKVIGVRRRSSTDNTSRIDDIIDHKNLQLIEGDITDSYNVNSWFLEFNVDEFYNLAAQSHVGTSFKQPKLTWAVDAEAVINILESIRNFSKHTKFYQASTSEMFGRNFNQYKDVKFQNEQTPFAPQSPYGVAKVAAHRSVEMYREAYNLYCCSGILFNHESERRGENFVTRKITKWLGDFVRWRNLYLPWGEDKAQFYFETDYICTGRNPKDKFPKLRLGNLDASRDWGHAQDYIEAMWLMLQQESPDDYVICTGKTYTVDDFLQEAFKAVCIDDYLSCVVQDPKFMRPAEVDYLCGDSTKAYHNLGWEPKVAFEELVRRMVYNDLHETSLEKI